MSWLLGIFGLALVLGLLGGGSNRRRYDNDEARQDRPEPEYDYDGGSCGGCDNDS